MDSKELPSVHPEAITAYSDENVLQAFSNIDWYTPAYIEEVRNNEPQPEREGLGPFKDKLLGDFFAAKFNLNKENTAFLGARTFIMPGLVGFQGHFLKLKNTQFFDEEVAELAESLGVDGDYEIDRGFAEDIEAMLQSIIAPEKIRRKAVKLIHRWGSDRVKRDTLLLSLLTKKGVKAYMERTSLEK